MSSSSTAPAGITRAAPASPSTWARSSTSRPWAAPTVRRPLARGDERTVGDAHGRDVATGEWPADERGATSPLLLEGEVVGHWLRTRAGRRPLAIHAAWRTDPGTAVEVVLACAGSKRTPAPLREARRLARTARE